MSDLNFRLNVSCDCRLSRVKVYHSLEHHLALCDYVWTLFLSTFHFGTLEFRVLTRSILSFAKCVSKLLNTEPRWTLKQLHFSAYLQNFRGKYMQYCTWNPYYDMRPNSSSHHYQLIYFFFILLYLYLPSIGWSVRQWI